MPLTPVLSLHKNLDKSEGVMDKLLAVMFGIVLGATGQCQEPHGLDARNEVDRSEKEAPVWDCAMGQHVVWHVHIDGFSGSPVVYRGKVLLGTNYSLPRNRPSAAKAGVMSCFSKARGEFLWQAVHPRLLERDNDMPGAMYNRSSVDGDRVYYVSNAGELVCLDLNGFHGDKNDGPIQKETHTRHTDAKVIWKLDMVGKLGVYKRDAADAYSQLPGTLVVNDLVYCVTGNGNGPGMAKVPKPNAPSFLAVDKMTGKIAWSSNAPGKDIIYGQWSAPVFARVDGLPQVIFPGGDGLLYSFEPLTGHLLWKIDLNPPGATRRRPGSLGTRDFFVAVPTVAEDNLYVGMSQEPEAGTDPRRPLFAIDLGQAQKGPERAIRWRFVDKEFGGTFGSTAVADEVVYTLGGKGVLFALDLQTGRELWRSHLSQDGGGDLLAPYVHAGKVFAGDGSTLFVFRSGRTKKCLGRYEFDDLVQGMPTVDGEILYVTTRKSLWALHRVSEPAGRPDAERGKPDQRPLREPRR
jgi:outer membrane protein assembly factor BamB